MLETWTVTRLPLYYVLAYIILYLVQYKGGYDDTNLHVQLN
jgi:hypothetical protein